MSCHTLSTSRVPTLLSDVDLLTWLKPLPFSLLWEEVGVESEQRAEDWWVQWVATLLSNDSVLEVAPFSISRDVAALLPIYITCHVQEMTRGVVWNKTVGAHVKRNLFSCDHIENDQFWFKEFLITPYTPYCQTEKQPRKHQEIRNELSSVCFLVDEECFHWLNAFLVASSRAFKRQYCLMVKSLTSVSPEQHEHISSETWGELVIFWCLIILIYIIGIIIVPTP